MFVLIFSTYTQKDNFITFNDCPLCGKKPENQEHFFIKCTDLAVPRAVLMGTLTPLLAFLPSILFPPRTKFQHDELLNLLLYGSPLLTDDRNKIVFIAVHKYIEDSKRF